jgi:ribose transport system substrate-binding protein
LTPSCQKGGITKIIRVVIGAVILFAMQNATLSQEKLKIAVIPKSDAALFWKSVKGGAKLGAAALGGVEILWDAPVAEDNADKQIAIVEQCIAQNVAGIMLSPIHQDALVAPVSKAMNKGIPVLIFDSALKGTAGKDIICFVGINNRKAGGLAGRHLAELLNGRGKVVLMRHVKGQVNTTEREEGFLEAISQYRHIQVTVKDVYSGGTVDDAKKASLSMLDKLREANGVFCPNEHTTVGMLSALQEARLAGKIKFVGFDTPSLVVEALKKGEVSALVAQDPARMGYQGVKTLVDHLRGKKIATDVDIDVKIVTRENLQDPEIQKLLSIPGTAE